MFHEIIRPLVSPIARAIYQPTIEGLENVPRTGAAILAPNHLSFAENWIIPTALPRPVHFLIKVEYVQGPGAGGRLVAAFYRQLGYVPVQRGGPRDTVGGSLENALKVLAAGKVFAIYRRAPGPLTAVCTRDTQGWPAWPSPLERRLSRSDASARTKCIPSASDCLAAAR